MQTKRRKDYLNPRGEGLLVKDGQNITAGKYVEIDPGVNNGIRLANDFSADIIGVVSVSNNGIIQQTGEATVEVAHDYRTEGIAGEEILAGENVVIKPSDGKYYVWYPVSTNATVDVTLATTATGGTLTVVIDGVEVTIATGTGTASSNGTALESAINANKHILSKNITAANSSGTVTLTCKNGESGNALTVTATTTDGAQTVTVANPTFAGGVGFVDRAIVGRALENLGTNEQGKFLIKVGG